MTPEKLMDAVYSAWSKCLPIPYSADGIFAPANGVTHCNEYVQLVSAAFDVTDLKGLLANDMYELMRDKTNEWTLVSGEVAQQHANVGALVIAAWFNPEGPHGHVSIVVPGFPAASEKWHDPGCPVLANVGEIQFCKIGITANWAFGQEPSYFVLNSSLAA